MKFMWESFDDVLQAELQGDNRFTDFLGRHRLWAVWPPLVTSDGKWPSQNSGEETWQQVRETKRARERKRKTYRIEMNRECRE